MNRGANWLPFFYARSRGMMPQEEPMQLLLKKPRAYVLECAGCGAFIARWTLKAVVKDRKATTTMKCLQCGKEVEVKKPFKLFSD